MTLLSVLPPPGTKAHRRPSRGWLLAGLLAAPSMGWAGSAGGDVGEGSAEQTFEFLSANVGEQPAFLWAGMDILSAEPGANDGFESLLMPSAIPEPQAATMWLTALVAIGFIARRRSRG